MARIALVALVALRALCTVVAVRAVAEVEDADEGVELPAAGRAERRGLHADDSGSAVGARVAFVALGPGWAAVAVAARVALRALGPVVPVHALGPGRTGGAGVPLVTLRAVLSRRTGRAARAGWAARVEDDPALTLRALLRNPEDAGLLVDTRLDRLARPRRAAECHARADQRRTEQRE